jgi:tetratricopeptide (TPR) repeat protein
MSLFSRITDPVSLGWFSLDTEAAEESEEDPWRQGGFAGVRILCSVGTANLAAKNWSDAESAFRNALGNLWNLLGTGPDADDEDEDEEDGYPFDVVGEGSPWCNTLAQAHAGRGYAMQGMKKWDEAAEELETALKINPKNAGGFDELLRVSSDEFVDAERFWDPTDYLKTLKKIEEDERKEREARERAERLASEQARKEEQGRARARARARAQAQQQQQQQQQQQRANASSGGYSGAQGSYYGAAGNGGSSSSGGRRPAPPPKEDKVDYFEVLGVSAEASMDDIKKVGKDLDVSGSMSELTVPTFVFHRPTATSPSPTTPTVSPPLPIPSATPPNSTSKESPKPTRCSSTLTSAVNGKKATSLSSRFRRICRRC